MTVFEKKSCPGQQFRFFHYKHKAAWIRVALIEWFAFVDCFPLAKYWTIKVVWDMGNLDKALQFCSVENRAVSFFLFSQL